MIECTRRRLRWHIPAALVMAAGLALWGARAGDGKEFEAGAFPQIEVFEDALDEPSDDTEDSDDLERYKARQAVRIQKAIRLVKGLIAEARQVEPKNPIRARSLLRTA